MARIGVMHRCSSTTAQLTDYWTTLNWGHYASLSCVGRPRRRSVIDAGPAPPRCMDICHRLKIRACRPCLPSQRAVDQMPRKHWPRAAGPKLPRILDRYLFALAVALPLLLAACAPPGTRDPGASEMAVTPRGSMRSAPPSRAGATPSPLTGPRRPRRRLSTWSSARTARGTRTATVTFSARTTSGCCPASRRGGDRAGRRGERVRRGGRAWRVVGRPGV